MVYFSDTLLSNVEEEEIFLFLNASNWKMLHGCVENAWAFKKIIIEEYD